MDKLDPLAHPLLQWWVKTIRCAVCFHLVVLSTSPHFHIAMGYLDTWKKGSIFSGVLFLLWQVKMSSVSSIKTMLLWYDIVYIHIWISSLCFYRIISSNRSHIVKLPLSRVGNQSNIALCPFYKHFWMLYCVIWYVLIPCPLVSDILSSQWSHRNSNWNSCTPPTSSSCSAAPQPRKLVFALPRSYTAALLPSSELNFHYLTSCQ